MAEKATQAYARKVCNTCILFNLNHDPSNPSTHPRLTALKLAVMESHRPSNLPIQSLQAGLHEGRVLLIYPNS